MTGHLPDYQIYAIRHGVNTVRIRAQNFINDPDPAALLQMDFYSWVLVGPDRTVVVDTGMKVETAARYGHTPVMAPPEALAQLGIDPASVDTVLLTHAHYDHVGHIDAFPQARFWMQAREMAYVTGPWMEHALFRHAYLAPDIAALVGLLHAGRLHLHGPDAGVAPGVTVHWVGGHCDGQEIVRVHTARGWVVLASDALHYFEELERGKPYAVAFNISDMIAAHGRIRELADSDDHIVPAHDPRVADLWPAAGPGLDGRILRVDVAPVAAGS
ncbi:N-acyl homoserine lactonase family protein [Chachezhania sediminis]|uniref:N-acyl homoserine lactonase family protein n=1 Tax=Chachezhania sediminis TaxID=2599291 RepID=UPI00131CF4DB|nr:N-acyl homoserine lactonase family protein [Chachezhania sediminis]